MFYCCFHNYHLPLKSISEKCCKNFLTKISNSIKEWDYEYALIDIDIDIKYKSRQAIAVAVKLLVIMLTMNSASVVKNTLV